MGYIFEKAFSLAAVAANTPIIELCKSTATPLTTTEAWYGAKLLSIEIQLLTAVVTNVALFTTSTPGFPASYCAVRGVPNAATAPGTARVFIGGDDTPRFNTGSAAGTFVNRCPVTNAWSTPPTLVGGGTDYFRRIYLEAGAGNKETVSYPSGGSIMIANMTNDVANTTGPGGVVLWNIGAAATADMLIHVRWEEIFFRNPLAA